MPVFLLGGGEWRTRGEEGPLNCLLDMFNYDDLIHEMPMSLGEGHAGKTLR